MPNDRCLFKILATRTARKRRSRHTIRMKSQPPSTYHLVMMQGFTEPYRTHAHDLEIRRFFPAILFHLHPQSSTLPICHISYSLIATQPLEPPTAPRPTNRYLTYYRKQIRVVGFVARDRFDLSTHFYLTPSCLAVGPDHEQTHAPRNARREPL
jgi:hypothetical protein